MFTAVYRKCGKWWAAYVEEVPGVNTQGATIEEARANLKEALALILETNRELAREQERDPMMQFTPQRSNGQAMGRHAGSLSARLPRDGKGNAATGRDEEAKVQLKRGNAAKLGKRGENTKIT